VTSLDSSNPDGPDNELCASFSSRREAIETLENLTKSTADDVSFCSHSSTRIHLFPRVLAVRRHPDQASIIKLIISRRDTEPDVALLARRYVIAVWRPRSRLIFMQRPNNSAALECALAIGRMPRHGCLALHFLCAYRSQSSRA